MSDENPRQVTVNTSYTPPSVWLTPRTWTRRDSEFFISNDPALLSIQAVKKAHESGFLYWATTPIPEEVIQQMLYGSMSFGVYKRSLFRPSNELATPSADDTEQIGLARAMTDGATFAYLSDVYVLPEYQGKGLGRWLVECIAEIFSKENMPYLRRIMLITGDEHIQEFYAKILNMKVIGHEARPDLGRDLAFLCARPNAQP